MLVILKEKNFLCHLIEGLLYIPSLQFDVTKYKLNFSLWNQTFCCFDMKSIQILCVVTKSYLFAKTYYLCSNSARQLDMISQKTSQKMKTFPWKNRLNFFIQKKKRGQLLHNFQLFKTLPPLFDVVFIFGYLISSFLYFCAFFPLVLIRNDILNSSNLHSPAALALFPCISKKSENQKWIWIWRHSV